MGLTRYSCDAAWLGGDAAVADVVVSCDGGRITAVEAGAAAPAGAVHLRGLTLPGFANAHSHAFHRVLRGRTEQASTFWSWREVMYAVAEVLDPDRYRRLARAVFAEMALAGFVTVGEFHYLHHPAGGGRYAEPNAMGVALAEAAADAGVRLTILDACYLESAPGRAPEGVQSRFSDGDAGAWAARVDDLGSALRSSGGPGVRVGAAVHSLRAVPPRAAATVAAWAAANGAPLHAHVSEQPAENEAVETAYGAPPVALLAEAGALGPATTVVHATHLHPTGAGTLGRSRTQVCMCPTTERALADGIGPAALLAQEGSPIVLGSDSHAVVDPFEEMRALEMDERLASLERGRFAPADLLHAATAAGHASLGWDGGGLLAPGAPADLVTVSLGSIRLAGARAGGGGALAALPAQVVFAAGAADVTDVVIGGRQVVAGGRHQLVADPARALEESVAEVLHAVARR